MILLLIFLLFPQDDHEVYWTTHYQCQHTRMQWKPSLGTVAIYNDTLFVYNSDFIFKAAVERREKVRGNPFIATCCGAVWIEPDFILFITPEHEIIRLRRYSRDKAETRRGRGNYTTSSLTPS